MAARTFINKLKDKARLYWAMIKSLQTTLLLVTGLAGFVTSRCPWFDWQAAAGVAGSLFLAISGSTVLNMWYDRDIDAQMKRTCRRPLPSGQVRPGEALALGLALSFGGLAWAWRINGLYAAVVFAGLFFDVVVYTVWLKRRTAWAIVWGGIAGAMPVLAGRALGVGGLDWIGFTLALAVLLWIPTHILSFSMRYHQDYKRAGVPTFPSTYGFETTRRLIAASSLAAAVSIGLAALGLGLSGGYLRLIGVLSIGLLALAVSSMVRPTEQVNFGLFKYASLYMLGAMLLMAADIM